MPAHVVVVAAWPTGVGSSVANLAQTASSLLFSCASSKQPPASRHAHDELSTSRKYATYCNNNVVFRTTSLNQNVKMCLCLLWFRVVMCRPTPSWTGST